MPSRRRKSESATATDTTAVTATVQEDTMTTTAPAFDFAALASAARETEMPAQARITGPGKYDNNPFVEPMRLTLTSGTPLGVDVPGNMVRETTGYLRAAAKEIKSGSRLLYVFSVKGVETKTANVKDVPEDETMTVHVAFLAKPAKKSGDTITCNACGKTVTVTADGKVRKHGERGATPCESSGTDASAE